MSCSVSNGLTYRIEEISNRLLKSVSNGINVEIVKWSKCRTYRMFEVWHPILNGRIIERIKWSTYPSLDV